MALARGKFAVLQIVQDGSVVAILSVEDIPWKDMEKLQDEATRIFGGEARLVLIDHRFVRQANQYHGAVDVLKDWRRMANL
jgi:hypothetical protein